MLALAPTPGHAAELFLDGSVANPLALSTANSLLTNGNFEDPTAANGGGANNLGTVPTGWAVQTAAGADNSAASNLISGSTLGSGTTLRLGVDPFDTSPGAQQSLDINGAGQVVQNFSPMVTGPVRVSIDFGGRDSGSDTSAGSYWSIYLGAATTPVATSSGSPVKPGVGQWSSSTINTTVSLTAGQQYRFVVTLDNTQQVDGASIVSVPEPTALTAAGIGAGLLGWIGRKRRRS